MAAPAHGRGAGPLARLGPRRPDVELPRLGPTRVGLRGRHQAANVAVADALLDALDDAGIATADPEPGVAGMRPRSGPVASSCWSWWTVARSCSTGRTTPPAPPRSPRPSTTCARTSRRAADPGRGVHGRQGRRWYRDGARRRRSAPRRSGDRDDGRRGARDAGRRARRALAKPPGPSQRDRGPRPARGARARLAAPGTTVVAGSLYLVGAVRAHLVDDPDLRDPDPEPPLDDSRPTDDQRRPRPHPDRPGHVRLGRADVRDGHPQRHARFVLGRRPPRGHRPRRSGRGDRAPDGRRRRRPARYRRRVDPTRARLRRCDRGDAPRDPGHHRA